MKNGVKNFGSIQDCILFFVNGKKSDKKYTWNPVYTPYDESYLKSAYKHVEEETGRIYRLDNLLAPKNVTSPSLEYPVMGVTRRWRYKQSRMQELMEQGRVIQTKAGNVPMYKRYLDEMPGKVLQDMWWDIDPPGTIEKKDGEWGVVQKPIKLIERVLSVISNEGDIILDIFAGSSTTAVAAENLGRQWIMVEQLTQAEGVIKRRIPGSEVRRRPPQQTGVKETAFDIDTSPIMQPYNLPLTTTYSDNDRLRKALCDVYGPFCAYCGRYFDVLALFECEHVKSREEGGQDGFGNRVLSCTLCNGYKGGKHTVDETIANAVVMGWTKPGLEARVQVIWEHREKVLNGWKPPAK